jgi:hypothetical protein
LALEPAEARETGVLYLHGGGYAVGSAYGYRPLAGALVAAAGVGALVADYRLAPEHPFPAALEDAISAYRWLVEQRGADQIVLAGDSVGGGLVCSLLLALRGQNLPQPAGAVLLCPAIDLSGEMMVDADPQHAETMRRTIAAYLNGHPVDDPVVSPLLGDLSGLPPLLVQAATGDLVLPESRRLVELATEHGSTRGSSSTRSTRTSSTSSGRSSPRPPTRSSPRAPSSASGSRAGPRRRRRGGSHATPASEAARTARQTAARSGGTRCFSRSPTSSQIGVSIPSASGPLRTRASPSAPASRSA